MSGIIQKRMIDITGNTLNSLGLKVQGQKTLKGGEDVVVQITGLEGGKTFTVKAQGRDRVIPVRDFLRKARRSGHQDYNNAYRM